ncbi:ankyrin repeat domain-containing protein 62-like [Dunckerocampus dactyliophorus]|uniref:ankyrin repeat domain-containing protein 62-like n=1 Tax=Dunckerocampus dactyliophorus TaxID=161453 RepID=UPI0024055E92|nr:ankyrin repeat domain-containing protein 62-like [Dunckerocampus dactyliophorus]
MKKILFNISKKLRTGTADSGSVHSAGYEVKKEEMRNIHKAAWKGDVAKMERLSKSYDINEVDQHNRTALHLACANGHFEVVKLLVAKKAMLNVCDSQNRSALMKAVQGQHDHCVSILLENNADPNLADTDGNTALHLAASFSSISTVALFMKKDVDLNAQNLEGLTPLALAVQQDYVEVAEFLLKTGADVNILDKDQRSPLMVAASNGYVNMVRLLLQFEADAMLTDNKGQSAEEYAATNGHQACALLITEHDARRSLAGSSSQAGSSKKTTLQTRLSLTGIHSPTAEHKDSVDSISGHAQKEYLIQHEGKRKGQTEGQIDLLDELGLGALDSVKDSSDADISSNISRRSLLVCAGASVPEEFPERASPSVEEEVLVDVSPKMPVLLPKTICSDETLPPFLAPRPQSLMMIIAESEEESVWDQGSLSSSCSKTKADNQQLQAAVRAGSSQLLASEGKGCLQSDEQQQQETVPLESQDEKSCKEVETSEAKSVFNNFVGALKGTLGQFKSERSTEEKQVESSTAEQESCDEEEGRSLMPPTAEVKSMVLIDVHQQRESVPLFQKPEEPFPGESPQPPIVKKENSVDFAKPGPSHSQQLNLNREEPESAQEAARIVSVANPNAASDTGASADGQPATLSQTEASDQVEKPVTFQRELEESQFMRQLTFNIGKPERQSLEDTSQLPVVSEARGLRQADSVIGRDLLVVDSTLSDLSEDDISRWQIRERLRRTLNNISNTDENELSEESDELISSSEDSDLLIQILDAVTDPRSKKKLQDILYERCILKETGHHVFLADRLRQQESNIRALEKNNLELESEVAHIRIQLKREQENASNTIKMYKNAKEKLEEERRHGQMLWAVDHNTLGTLLQKVNCQTFKQQEMEEEYKRSKSNEEHLRSELEVVQMHNNLKQRDLLQENEALKEELEDIRQDLKLASDNQTLTVLDWNTKIQELRYEITLANARLEKEQKDRDILVAENQAIRSRLAEAEQARLIMEKALLQEKEEHQRLSSEAQSQREAVTKLTQKLSKVKAHAGNLESDVHKFEVQLAEKNLHVNTVQRENEQIAARVKELEAAVQAEKELVTRTVARQEATQELLNQAQHDGKLFRQQLEDAQNKAIANENALTDAQKSFNDILFKLRSDSDDRIQGVQERNKELTSKATEQETHIRKLEQEKTDRQINQRQLQQDFADMSRKLSKCEASLEITTTYRSDLEEEKARLQKEMDKLKVKLEEKEAQRLQTERNMNNQMILLDEREKELGVAARKQKEAQAAASASNTIVKQLEEAMQRLEIENIRLHATAKQHSHKFDALQKVAQEDARIRVQLEDLVTSLQSSKITLEDQLNKEVQRQSVLSNNAQDSHAMWQEEMKSRSKLALRLAELEKEKKELNSEVDMEKKKAENAAEQKKAVDLRLEQEMKRNTELQKEMYRLQTLLKTAKRKLQDQQTSSVEREKLCHQINELQSELEREMSSRIQLEKGRRQLEEEVLSLRRSQGPTMDMGAQGLTGNVLSTLGAHLLCQCSKQPSPMTEGPACSVEEYLARMRHDLDMAMSRELGMPSARLDMSSGRVSPVSRARQQYANVLKRNHEV